jgi:hypothetical protein
MVRRWTRRRQSPLRAVASVIAVALLVLITLVVGTILWQLKLNLPQSAPTIGYLIRSGGTNPVWGDPTDCTIDYYHYPYANGSHVINPDFPPPGYAGVSARDYQCTYTATGNFSLMNATQIIITQHTPDSIPLNQLLLTFECHATNAMGDNYTTTLVSGTLASMTWFPGSSVGPAPDAPHLGVCGTFAPTGAYSTLYNRLGIFVPLYNGSGNATELQNGDTFILYVHTPGQPLDYSGDCQAGYPVGVCVDADDFHGAPPWCFVVVNACTLTLAYIGLPTTLLMSVDVYGLGGQGS